MSENNKSTYLYSFIEGSLESLADLLIESLYLAIIVINRAMQQLAPSSQYTAQLTMLSLCLVVVPLVLIIGFAFIRPLIDWLDALFYAIGLLIGTVIVIGFNINYAGLFSHIIGNVAFNMLLILVSIILGCATRIYISKQEQYYW
jgi:hypothetical protein